jgi:hypothetical protein
VKRALILVALAACGGGAQHPAGGSSDAVIVIRSNVRDAQVFVDGRFIATLRALGGGLALDPGTHRIKLAAEDFFDRYLEVTLARAEKKQVMLELAPVLP